MGGEGGKGGGAGSGGREIGKHQSDGCRLNSHLIG